MYLFDCDFLAAQKTSRKVWALTTRALVEDQKHLKMLKACNGHVPDDKHVSRQSKRNYRNCNLGQNIFATFKKILCNSQIIPLPPLTMLDSGVVTTWNLDTSCTKASGWHANNIKPNIVSGGRGEGILSVN